MTTFRDEALVLRVHKLGEADRIITMLTRRNGKVRAVGKGVRRTSSRFGSRLEPFSHIDVQCYAGRSLDVVTQVESLDAFGADVAADYARYTAGSSILETTDRLTEEREPTLRLYLLLLAAIRSLATAAHDPSLVLDAFLLRSTSISGWQPALVDCARCGTPGPHRSFSVPAGGSVCPACRPGGAVNLAADTLALMVALLGGDWETADAAPRGARRDATGLVAAHLQWHLERGLRSLRMVDRTPAGQRPGSG